MALVEEAQEKEFLDEQEGEWWFQELVVVLRQVVVDWLNRNRQRQRQ